jgi:hypothetical protein
VKMRILIFLSLAVVCLHNACNSYRSPKGGSNDGSSQTTYDPGSAAGGGNLRLTHGNYVVGLLNEVFGSTSALSATSALISGPYTQFGGTCEKYASTPCPAQSSQGSVIPGALTTRFALVTRACDRILQNDAAVTAALAKIGGNATTFPIPTTVAAAYSLFYPGRNLSANDVGNALLDIAEQAKSQALPALEAWRFIFLTLCVSPDWQIP